MPKGCKPASAEALWGASYAGVPYTFTHEQVQDYVSFVAKNYRICPSNSSGSGFLFDLVIQT